MIRQKKSRYITLLSLSFLLPAMVTLLSGCPAIVAGTAATGVVLAQDRRTTGTIVEDQSITLKAMKAISDELNDDEDAHVSPHTYNNNLLLVGQAPTEDLRERIEYTVRQIEKVRNVYNEIKIAAPTSTLVRSNDSWITTKIKSEMLMHKEINVARVKVVTEDGVVYLLGILGPKEEGIAVDIARHTKGVKKVVKIIEPNA